MIESTQILSGSESLRLRFSDGGSSLRATPKVCRFPILITTAEDVMEGDDMSDNRDKPDGITVEPYDWEADPDKLDWMRYAEESYVQPWVTWIGLKDQQCWALFRMLEVAKAIHIPGKAGPAKAVHEHILRRREYFELGKIRKFLEKRPQVARVSVELVQLLKVALADLADATADDFAGKFELAIPANTKVELWWQRPCSNLVALLHLLSVRGLIEHESSIASVLCHHFFDDKGKPFHQGEITAYVEYLWSRDRQRLLANAARIVDELERASVRMQAAEYQRRKRVRGNL